MEKSIIELRKEIESLNKRKAELDKLLSKAIDNVMEDVSNAQEINRLSDKSFVVKMSDLVGVSWNPSYHDWKQSSILLKKHLSNKPMETWKEVLKEMMISSKSRNYLYLGKNEVVSKVFVSKVIELL